MVSLHCEVVSPTGRSSGCDPEHPSNAPPTLGLPAASRELPHSLCRAGSPAVADVPSADDTPDPLCPEVY